MARLPFAGTANDYTFSTYTLGSQKLVALTGATLTFYDAETGGNQVTDLTDASGTAITSVAVPASGDIPRFYGPDGVTELWASANGSATRTLVTASMADQLLTDYVPVQRSVNGHTLSADVTLAAGDVGAVPTTRKVNGKALSGDVTLAAGDVGAATAAQGAKADAAEPAASLEGDVAGKIGKGGALDSALSAAYAHKPGSVYDLCAAPYNVKPGDDITSALQQAVNDIAASGESGDIFISEHGLYYLNGPLQTGTVTGTAPAVNYTYNGQILFPAVAKANSLSIRIRGAAPPYKGGSVSPVNGTVLRTNITSGWVFDAIPAYSAYNAHYPWTNVCPVIQDLAIESASTDPQHGAIRATTCQTFKMSNVLVSCLGVPSGTGTGPVEAVALPQVDNDGDVTVRDSTIRGWGTGLRLQEHATLSSVRISFCSTACVSDGSGHSNTFPRLNVENCPTVFRVEALTYNPLQVNGHIDWECPSVTPGPLVDLSASGIHAIRGHLNIWPDSPRGGYPFKWSGTDTGDPLPELGLGNLAFGGRNSFDSHPEDDFTRIVTNMASNAPGFSWPTLTPWFPFKGTFKIVGNAGSVGTLYSTNGTSESQALVVARNKGESRVISTTLTLGTGYHFAQWVCYQHGGGHSKFFLSADLQSGNLKLNGNLGAGQVTLATAAVTVAAGESHTITVQVQNNALGQPSVVTVYLDGTQQIQQTLTATQSAALDARFVSYAPVMDGISLYEQNTGITKFRVSAP